MKITIGNTTYTKIKSLSFSPETDITGDTVPINNFEAVIVTRDVLNPNVTYGAWAYLYDDLDNLWARYWISYAEHEEIDTIRIIAHDQLAFLDQRKLPATMYDDGISVILGDIFGSMTYVVDESLADVIYYEEGGVTQEVIVSGFCPEQTARERLLWLCLVEGAYVQTYFCENITLRCLTDDTTFIPINKTFWKPSITYRDYVTAIKITYYSYTEGTPQTTDEWVTDGTDYYIQTASTFTLSNSYAPSGAPENVVEVDGITLINVDDVSNIALFLAKYYFNRTEVDMDVINNAEYKPGDKIVGYRDGLNLVSGYIQSADFTFGLQARSTLHVLGVTDVEGATLTILYIYEDEYNEIQLDKQEFVLPVGYEYSITNPYIDQEMQNHRYVYIPQNEAAEGTVASGGTEDEELYDIALDMNYEDNVLSIYSVDELELVEEEDTEVDPETEEEVTVTYNVLEIS